MTNKELSSREGADSAVAVSSRTASIVESHARLLAALKDICDRCEYPTSRRDPIVTRVQIDAARAAIAAAEGR